MGDTPAIAFGLLCLALGILIHKKRGKLSRIPSAVLNRVICALMFLGGTGLAATFIGDWLKGLDFSIGQVTSGHIVVGLVVLLGVAVAIDVFDGHGLRPSTYGMIAFFPILYATAGGSLAWVRQISAAGWSTISGAM
ncbi:hypothetical protein ACIBG4_40895 [Nonomuraea sp. NPDC050383]|uniref:hypothetical protein n=1 Tax=Nonomuraea sp. NPDC050383 TaxID=3364362 RepID=UPI0037959944